MKILGLSAYYHDSAAAIIDNGVVVAAAQEERFTRRKHDKNFPENAILYCLKQAQCDLKNLDAIVYYEKPWLKFDRILETYIANAPFGFKHFLQSFPLWVKQKLFLRQELIKKIKKIDKEFVEANLLFSEHHLSHAASAFYPSPFRKALVVTFDGVGEWTTLSVARGEGKALKIEKELFFPHSLGLFYSAITAFCGFKVNSGEYKVMGLAPYGEARFTELFLKHVIHLKDDGSFSLDLKYFDFLKGEKMFSDKMRELLGVPHRDPESPLEQVHMDIAASLQKTLEISVLHILNKLQMEYAEDNLCLAGGVALNCVANSYILKSKLFKNVWVQPAAGDAGGSLGAALAAYHLHFEKPRDYSSCDSSGGVYFGPEFSQQEVELACQEQKVSYEILSEEELLEAACRELQKGSAIGWFQGRMEFGPRALGARSILADSRNEEMQKRLNLKIKFRESFRPFAPIVRDDDFREYFEWDVPSPYMMFVAPVKKELRRQEPNEIKKEFGLRRLNYARSSIPAITHIDYTARLQTVSKEHNLRLHKLLGLFKQEAGCSVLVNTSFNVRGEPIVCSPRDALNCFFATDIDVLIMENVVVYKEKQEGVVRMAERHFELD